MTGYIVILIQDVTGEVVGHTGRWRVNRPRARPNTNCPPAFGSPKNSRFFCTSFPRLNDTSFKLHEPFGEHLLCKTIASRIGIAANATKVLLNP